MATIAAEASESDQGGRSKRSTDDGGVPVFIGRSVLQRGGGSSDIVDSNNSVINIPPSSTILSCMYTAPVGMTGLFTELKMVTSSADGVYNKRDYHTPTTLSRATY
jgi:hypothetical protein